MVEACYAKAQPNPAVVIDVVFSCGPYISRQDSYGYPRSGLWVASALLPFCEVEPRMFEAA